MDSQILARGRRGGAWKRGEAGEGVCPRCGSGFWRSLDTVLPVVPRGEGMRDCGAALSAGVTRPRRRPPATGRAARPAQSPLCPAGNTSPGSVVICPVSFSPPCLRPSPELLEPAVLASGPAPTPPQHRIDPHFKCNLSARRLAPARLLLVIWSNCRLGFEPGDRASCSSGIHLALRRGFCLLIFTVLFTRPCGPVLPVTCQPSRIAPKKIPTESAVCPVPS